MADRIKEIRQKQANGSFGVGVPIGADGIFIDMKSGLTLEEEFKLGGNCITNFSTNSNGSTIILEEFRKENQTVEFYKVYTSFETNNEGNTQIIQTLYWINENEIETVIKNKTVIFQKSETGGITIKEVAQ